MIYAGKDNQDTSSDFLAEQPVLKSFKRYEDIPDEMIEVNMTCKGPVWLLFFNRVARKTFARVGVILITPHNHVIPPRYSLTQPFSNNVSEYNALLMGMQIAWQLEIHHLEAYWDSKLMVNQKRGEYKVKNEHLLPYYHVTIQIATSFEEFYIDYVPQQENVYADALVSLAAILTLHPKSNKHIAIGSREFLCPIKYLRQMQLIHYE